MEATERFSDPKVIRGISALEVIDAYIREALSNLDSFSDPKVIRGISAVSPERQLSWLDWMAKQKFQ